MQKRPVSRRNFLASSIGGATAFQIIRPELVRGAGNEKLKAGLIGCGGRGTQALENLLTGCDNVEIVAMADVFEDRLEDSIRKTKALKPELSSRFKVDLPANGAQSDRCATSLPASTARTGSRRSSSWSFKSS